MDVAVLGEVRDGREVVRSWPVMGRSAWRPAPRCRSRTPTVTACLQGGSRTSCPTRTPTTSCGTFRSRGLARIGAYLGVPLTTLDARLYVLCCLAHEQRPQLGERDVLFLRGLGETIVAELDKRPKQQPTVST